MTLNTVTGDGTVKEIHIKAGPENHWMNYIKPSRLMVLYLERDWECSVVSCAQGIGQITLAPGNRFIRDMLFNERNHTIWERSEKS